MSEDAPFIVGIGGTTRPGSSSERALAAALAAAERAGARTRLFGGEALAGLPIYDPKPGERCFGARELAEAVRAADGLIIATPGYHGSVSGLVKNALDALEDLRDDARPYFDGRAVGLIVTADGAQAGGTTLSALRSIIHAMRGWPTPLGVALNASVPLFDDAGGFLEPRDARMVEMVARQVVEFAQMRRRP